MQPTIRHILLKSRSAFYMLTYAVLFYYQPQMLSGSPFERIDLAKRSELFQMCRFILASRLQVSSFALIKYVHSAWGTADTVLLIEQILSALKRWQPAKERNLNLPEQKHYRPSFVWSHWFSNSNVGYSLSELIEKSIRVPGILRWMRLWSDAVWNSRYTLRVEVS